MAKIRRALLVAVTIAATALGATACGPSHHHHHHGNCCPTCCGGY